MLPIFRLDEVLLNHFLNEDSLIIVTIVILSSIIHGMLTYYIIYKIIYFYSITNFFIITYLIFLIRLSN